jgi:hypothetical protein
MSRKLASIQKVIGIRPIEGGDKIEVCQVLGWECVTKKGEFKVGDFVVYCEVDSIMPEKQEFEFLRERKFRIRTIKLKKQISQGIVFPLDILPSDFPINPKNVEGTDVTEILGVKKHDPQLQEEKELDEQSHSKSKINKFLMNFSLYRFIYFNLNRKDKGWPSWIAKTDEERIQTCAKILTSRPESEWYVTEKVDGQSGTYFVGTKRHWGINRLIFGVCSRNVRLGKPNNSSYWAMAEKYNIAAKLLDLEEAGIVVQGECVGPKIQKNKYQLGEQDFLVFNVIDNGRKYALEEMEIFCIQNGFKMVPVINKNWTFNLCNCSTPDIIKELVNMSIGKSVLNPDVWREGIVVRLKDDPNVSFKVINPNFSLKYNE